MNDHPEQPEALDEGLDASLLSEAAQAEQTPQDLEAKILGLTDPAMLSLLDEACAAEAAPAGLTQRILAATSADAQPAVVGRIGMVQWRYAVAAGLLLAAGVGLWWASQQGGAPTPRLVEAPDTTGVSDDWTDNEAYSSDNALFADATQPVQNTLDSLAEDIGSDTLDIDAIWSDLDAYEQFLTETLAENTPSAT